MNRRPILLPLVVLMGGALGLQETEKDALEGRVEALEARVEAVEGYLQQQAAAAEKLSKALEESRSAGFTYGINPESREVLLEGLGQAASAARKKVPGKAEPGAEAPASRRGVRRGQ